MTTPTGPTVASVSVAVTPNTSTFNADLQAALRRAVDAVSDAADQMGDDIAQGVATGVARAQLALATLAEGLEQRVRTNVSVIGTFTTGLLTLGGTATKTGVQLGALGLAAGNAAFAFGALLGAASELSGVAVGLPALLGSAALVMGTLKLATQGVGEAFSAALSGDIEAITEASKDLAPAAQQLVSVVMDLDKRFDALKKTVQQNFFAPVATQFRGFATQATALAENGLPRIATELGKISGEFLQVAQSGTFFGGLRTLIDETVSGLQRWKGVSGEVANALGNLFKVGAQFSGDMIAGIGGVVRQFAEWVNTASATGELQQRLESALEAFAKLGRIVQNLSHTFGAFWFSAQEAGADFLGIIEGITATIDTFANSDAGIASITNLMESGATAAAILGDAIGRLLPTVGSFVEIMSGNLTTALLVVAPALRELITGFDSFAMSATGGIGDAIVMLAHGLSSLMQSVTPLLPVLGEIVGLLAEHFAATVNIAASVIGDFLDALAPVLPEIRDLIDTGLEAFTDALSMIADALMPLMPLLVELGTSILRLVVTAFTDIMSAVEPFLPVLTELATKILTALIEHFEGLLPAIKAVVPIVIDLVSKGLELLADILPVIVEAFKPFIPIIMDTAKRLGESLAPILPALVEGFKAIFEALAPVLPQLAQLAGDTLVAAAQLFTSLVQAVLPLVPPLIQIGTEILSVLVPAFNDILAAVTPLLPVLSDLAVRVLQEALLPVLQALLPVLPLIIEAFVEMLPSITLLLPPLVDLVVAVTPLIVLLADLANLILEVLVPAIEVIIVIIATRFTFAFLALGATIDAFKVAVEIAWDAIVTAIKIAWTIIKGIFDIAISLLQGDFTEAWQRFKRMIEDVWNQISGFVLRTLGRILDFVAEWGSKLWKATFDALAAIVGIFNEQGAEFVRSIGNSLTRVVQWFVSLPALVKAVFTSAKDWLTGAGLDIVQGLLNGMAEKAKGIYNWVMDNIVNPIKNAFEGVAGFVMGSPSKWMKQRGEWISEGLAIGIEDASAMAVQSTVDLVNAVKGPLDTQAFAQPSGIPFPSLPIPAFMTPDASQTSASSVITFGSGSIMVSFSGVVPSEADALMTGRTVGRGILDAIAQRDAQLAVRVL